MNTSKQKYADKLKSYVENNGYFAQVKIANLSIDLLNTYIRYLKDYDLCYLHVKSNQVCRINEKAGYKGSLVLKDSPSLLLFSKDQAKLFNFLKKHSILDLKYYNHNEKAYADYTLPKGPLGIKLDKKTPLDLIETYCNIKIVKGMLELLEPFNILQKSRPIDKGVCEILKTLRLRLKISRTELICAGKIDQVKGELSKYSDLYNSLKTDSAEHIFTKVSSLISGYEKVAYTFENRLLFKHSAGKRAIKLVKEALKLVKK